MPRYYFHIVDGQGTIWDEEGSDLPDLESVRVEALNSAHELVGEAIKQREPFADRTLRVCDADGKIVLELAFRSLSH